MSNNLQRVNKVTTRFEGDGIAIATFYKTHEKLGEIKSNDDRVTGLGFVMPEPVLAQEGVDPVDVTPVQKLAAYKDFMILNATAFGFVFDPIDRRLDGNKFPNHYDETNVLEVAAGMVQSKITEIVNAVQKTVDTTAKHGGFGEYVEGAPTPALSCTIGLPTLESVEKYKNEHIKYAIVKFPVTFTILAGSITLDVPVKVVSGQMKKPTELGDGVLTITGLKTALLNAGILPKVEKKQESAEESAEVAATTESVDQQA